MAWPLRVLDKRLGMGERSAAGVPCGDGLGTGEFGRLGARASITSETAGGDILETTIGYEGRLDSRAGRHRALCCTAPASCRVREKN